MPNGCPLSYNRIIPAKSQLTTDYKPMTKTSLELQSRDIAVLTDLRSLTILSLDQIRRLHWPDASREICRKRLSRLMNHGERWLANFTVPKPEMQAVGLQPGQVYHLSEAGRAWFRDQERPPGKTYRQRQALHDLLISEWFVRLSELARAKQADLEWRADWQIRFYASQQAQRATLVPDGLAILTGLTPQPIASFLELDFSREAHGRASSRIGRKIHGYDDYLKQWPQHAGLDGLDYFPAVLFLTHGQQRLENLAAAILKHRRGKVAYALALTDQVYQADDPLTAPLWRLIPAHDRSVSQPRPLVDANWLASVRVNVRPPARLPVVDRPPEPPPAKPPAPTSPAAPTPSPAKTAAAKPLAKPPVTRQSQASRPASRPAPVTKPAPPVTIPLSQTPILPGEVVLARKGWLSGVTRRLTGPPETGCDWSNALLQQAVAVGIPTQWQPLPLPAQELFSHLKLAPPAGILTIADTSLFPDPHFTQVERLSQRLAAYRELAYVWSEQRLRPAFPLWALLILPNSAQAVQLLEATLRQRRIISFCATTQGEFEQNHVPLLAVIWRSLYAQQTSGKVDLEPRPLLAWRKEG
ncbi:MAG: hypothetical protein Kow0031_22400 [Anaerolineae bacterium]